MSHEEYFDQRVRAALLEYFDGDQDKADQTWEFVAAKAEEFRPSANPEA